MYNINNYYNKNVELISKPYILDKIYTYKLKYNHNIRLK